MYRSIPRLPKKHKTKGTKQQKHFRDSQVDLWSFALQRARFSCSIQEKKHKTPGKNFWSFAATDRFLSAMFDSVFFVCMYSPFMDSHYLNLSRPKCRQNESSECRKTFQQNHLLAKVRIRTNLGTDSLVSAPSHHLCRLVLKATRHEAAGWPTLQDYCNTHIRILCGIICVCNFGHTSTKIILLGQKQVEQEQKRGKYKFFMQCIEGTSKWMETHL